MIVRLYVEFCVKQIQASIAETFRRQSEAVARRRSSSTKATAAAIVRKAHGFRGVQTSRSRGRGRGRGRSQYGPHSRYEDEEDDEDDDDEEEEEEEHDGETTSTEETTRNLGRKRRRPRISLSTENSEEDMSAKLRESGSIRNQDIEYEAKNVAGVANAGYGEAGRSGKGFALDVSSLCSSLLANAAKEKASEVHSKQMVVFFRPHSGPLTFETKIVSDFIDLASFTSTLIYDRSGLMGMIKCCLA